MSAHDNKERANEERDTEERDTEERDEQAAEPIDDAQEETAERRFYVLLGSLLLVFLTFQLNYLAFRHYERMDWTSDARFTLSERTEAEVRGLTQEVEILLFLSEKEELYRDVDELLTRYKALSPRLHVRKLDPDLNATETRAVAAQYDIRIGIGSMGESLADVALVVASGDRSWKISREDLVTPALSPSDTPTVDVTTERALTGAIVQVLSGERSKVCVATGRGELSIAGERSVYVLREELARENIDAEDIDASGLRAIPEGCDAVFVLGPQRAYSQDEARVLVDFARSGGSVLLALDPVIERERVQVSGFEEALSEIGILVDQDIVMEMDFSRVLGRSPADLFRVEPAPHALTTPLITRGGSVAVSGARSVRADEGSGASALLMTSSAAFGETDFAALVADADFAAGPEDLEGPLSVAVARELAAAQPGARGGRVVVIGDYEWLDPNLLAEPQLANTDLMLSIVGWLLDREAMISIPPRQSATSSLVMDEAAVSSVAMKLFLLLPLMVLCLGGYVWWSRRR